MKRSIKPTTHILIKASTNSEWDPIDFAIIHLTESFKDTMRLRLTNVIHFKEDHTFHNLTYWDSPSGYYCNSKNGTAKILRQDEDWAFVTLGIDEEQTFAVPENQLEADQLIVTKHGYANFKSYSKHTGEEYWTEWFSINQILNDKKSPSLDSLTHCYYPEAPIISLFSRHGQDMFRKKYLFSEHVLTLTWFWADVAEQKKENNF